MTTKRIFFNALNFSNTKRLILSLLFLSASAIAQPSTVEDGWTVFAKVRFTEKFYKEFDEYYLTPLFDTKIRFREGKEFTLKGHFLPFDLDEKNVVIISKHPYSMCFFCGGAGPESVAEIRFLSKHPKFKADQIISVTGKLKLNEKNIDHVNFILEEAVLNK